MRRRLIDRISLELSADVAAEVRRMSERTGWSLRKIIEEAIVLYLEHIRTAREDLPTVPAVSQQHKGE